MDERGIKNDQTTKTRQVDSSGGTGPTMGKPEDWPHIYAMTPASAEPPTNQRVPSTVVGDTPPLPMSVLKGGSEQQTSAFISPSPGNTAQNKVEALAALYQSSRRSRNNTPTTGVKPKAPIVFPPAPPLYFQKGGRESVNQQVTMTSSAAAGPNVSSILTGSVDTAGNSSRGSMTTALPASPVAIHETAQPSLSEDHTIEDMTPADSRNDEYAHSHRDAALTVPSLSSGSAASDANEILTGKLEGVEIASPQANRTSLKRSSPLGYHDEIDSEPPRKKYSIPCGAMSEESDELPPAASFDIIAYRSSRLSGLTTENGSPILEYLRYEREGTSQDIDFQLPLKEDKTPTETEREREDRIIRRKVQRLLLIKHCSTCRYRNTPMNEIRIPSSSEPFICKPCDDTQPKYASSTMLEVCPVTSRCAEGKALCAHIRTCKLQDCTYKRCVTSREVLGHYMSCKDRTCRICEPVRHKGRKRRIDHPPEEVDINPPEEGDIMRRKSSSSSLKTDDLWIENELDGAF